MERLWRSDRTRPARDRTPRCEDMVLCGTASSRAMSPAGRPSGSCPTSSRKVSSRVGWASAARARMTLSDSICRDLWKFRRPSRTKPPILALRHGTDVYYRTGIIPASPRFYDRPGITGFLRRFYCRSGISTLFEAFYYRSGIKRRRTPGCWISSSRTSTSAASGSAGGNSARRRAGTNRHHGTPSAEAPSPHGRRRTAERLWAPGSMVMLPT
jgi:hypothetical protein